MNEKKKSIYFSFIINDAPTAMLWMLRLILNVLWEKKETL